MKSTLRTRVTLIQRVQQQNNEEAWQEFVHFYRPFIFHITKQMNVQIDDINDLIQEILLKLWKSLPNYEKQTARFRTWLTTVIKSCAYNFFNKSRRQNSHNENELHPLLQQSVSKSDLELVIEKEWKLYLSELVMEKLKRVFKGNAITVFEMSLQGKNSDEIANELNLTTQSIYTLKNRVKSHFIAEMQRLIEELEF